MDCIVRINDILGGDFFYLSLEPITPIDNIKPGQFFMVRCSHSADPFLRRPMSVADFEKDGSRFGLIVQAVGRGTHLLSTLVPWDRVDVLGPFGTNFEAPEDAKSIWTVAGGSGVAPFLGLIESSKPGDIDYTVFLGAREAELLLFEERFSGCGADVVSATEDGSKGYHGLVTDPLTDKLNKGLKPDIIFTCGPSPMMRAVARIAAEREIRCFVSLENKMACGFGACVGCVALAHGENKYITVCSRGPVFDATEVEI